MTQEAAASLSYEETLKKKRTILRRKITITCNQMKELMRKRNSSTLLREFMVEVKTFLDSCQKVNEELCDQYADETEIEVEIKKTAGVP